MTAFRQWLFGQSKRYRLAIRRTETLMAWYRVPAGSLR